MGRGGARAALAVLALCAACAATLGGTLSAFNASSTTPSASFTAAADWTAPTASAAVIGRTTAYDTGYIKQGASYYVYANVTDTGNPASGIESVTAGVDTTTSAHPAVALVAGSYDAGGAAYNYRTAALTANSTLAAGSYAFTITSTDKAANAETQSFTVTVDNTAPAASDVQSTNVSGGTVGHLDEGDTLTLTYNSVIDPYSILSGWSGASTKVQVYLVDGGSANDSIDVYNTESTPAQIPVGVVDLGSKGYLTTGSGKHIVYGATGAATPSTMVQSGSSIVITLGTPSGASSTSTTQAAMIWTPSTSATDIAGNAVSANTATQTGATHANF
jgi:predicted ribosomally synthesized peptide with SipW-like signal peptide